MMSDSTVAVGDARPYAVNRTLRHVFTMSERGKEAEEEGQGAGGAHLLLGKRCRRVR